MADFVQSVWKVFGEWDDSDGCFQKTSHSILIAVGAKKRSLSPDIIIALEIHSFVNQRNAIPLLCDGFPLKHNFYPEVCLLLYDTKIL